LSPVHSWRSNHSYVKPNDDSVEIGSEDLDMNGIDSRENDPDADKYVSPSRLADRYSASYIPGGAFKPE